MVDLVGQYHNIKPEVDKAIEEVMETGTFIKGPAVKQFQTNLEEYLDVKHVIPCGNGTDALQISMMALGLQPGDEVITPSFTFIATAEVIALLGLKPVFVDVDPDTFTLNMDEVEKSITSNTKAILPVHLFGQCADMNRIMHLAEKHNLSVIEDTCQAIGAEYTLKDGSAQQAGTIGDLGAMSFFPSKNLGTFGDGGAIFTNNEDLAEKCRSITNHGMKRKYYHDDIGVNSRLDSLHAAILDVKLKYLDTYIANRQKAAEYYNRAFKNIPQLQTPFIKKDSTHVYHQYTLVTKDIDRDKLKEHLSEQGIASAVYYPVPIHLQNAYQHLGYKEGDLPVTEKLSKNVISLPMHTELTKDIQDEIIEAVKKFLK
ncbi:MAG: DegT/DnrJ/EryC1/StrS family aminotransferase [Bacteroidales bacterium]|nr:DegT/DnrJ/EryC1/StrS family aminotransferase [Bacteroidales bacterium]MCF8339223.1 DegT/DnrJ/EryC1/StrS family aminotransferase [Bacteroidales bacterium]